MAVAILLIALIILICVLLNKLTQKFGIPVLLAFIVLGLIFGTDGIFKIPFDNYALAEQVCSAALIFIMFYGGFGTNWNQAKPVAVKAGLLATLGVILTAGITGVLCHLILGIDLLEGLLIGSVLSSTDAASVFSILRSKKLGLKHNTDSMLELESGSNDPCSYMLTLIVLSLMNADITPGRIVLLVLQQFGFGILFGAAIGFGGALMIRRFRFSNSGLHMAFVTGVCLLSYAAASVAGGNGYLSTYLCGIILGNQPNHNQKALVNFFDGITSLMQMSIFFLLGLLATPSRIPDVFFTALAVMLILTLVARPLSVFAILSPFRCNPRQQMLVSFAGLRGAASIVFAIMAIVSSNTLFNDLYHIVFCIVLISISFQGSFLPQCASALKMTDSTIDVLKTFSDYSEKVDLQFIKVKITQEHPWAGKEIRAITMPPDTLIATLFRNDKRLIPSGKTQLQADDIAVLSAFQYHGEQEVFLHEYTVTAKSEWIGKTIQEFSPNPDELVIMLIRNNKTILPKGSTTLQENDVLVINSN